MKRIKKALAILLAVLSLIALIVPASAVEFSTNQTLRKGSRGTQVKYLQMNLNGMGYNAGTEDGIYGNNTYNAVIAYQKDYSLSADGIAGTKTLGSISGNITQLQSNLNLLGYNAGTADGIFGNKTKDALKSFQRNWNLYVDGIASKQMIQTVQNAVDAMNSTGNNSSRFASTVSKVRTYSVKKDGEAKLSENFKVREFKCSDGSDAVLIDDKLVALLQDIRDHFGCPVTINSGYRTPSHNAATPNAKTGSKHTLGMAADISVQGVSPVEVAKYAQNLGCKGIGLYNSKTDGYFVHVDTRTECFYWIGQSIKPTSGF